MTHNLMTHKEMVRRLGEGEHPLALSVEKWRRVQAQQDWATCGDRPHTFCRHCEEPTADEYAHGDTCALCEAYKSCPKCPLCIAGYYCEVVGSPFENAYDELCTTGHPGPAVARMVEILESLAREAGVLP